MKTATTKIETPFDAWPIETPRKRPDQTAFSATVLILCALAGLALGASVALWQADLVGIDGYREEGVPVSCWHWRGQ